MHGPHELPTRNLPTRAADICTPSFRFSCEGAYATNRRTLASPRKDSPNFRNAHGNHAVTLISYVHVRDPTHGGSIARCDSFLGGDEWTTLALLRLSSTATRSGCPKGCGKLGDACHRQSEHGEQCPRIRALLLFHLNGDFFCSSLRTSLIGASGGRPRPCLKLFELRDCTNIGEFRIVLAQRAWGRVATLAPEGAQRLSTHDDSYALQGSALGWKAISEIGHLLHEGCECLSESPDIGVSNVQEPLPSVPKLTASDVASAQIGRAHV